MKINRLNETNELEKRAQHHKKFQKGCLFPFSDATSCSENATLAESADKLLGGESDEGKIVRFKKASSKYRPGIFKIEKAFVKVYRGYTDVKYTLICEPHDSMGTRYHIVEPDDIEVVPSVDSENKPLSEAKKNALTKTKILSEAIEKGVKVYDVEKDGPPEVGRQIIAFVDSHEEYTILTRQDKDVINKKSWDDKEGHKSADGEYYAGKNGWIYALGYSKYIYLDELDLIPQKHFDKVAREIEAGNKQKVDLEQKLARIYGDELASKIAPEVISVTRGGRRVELPHYYSYLLAMPKHRDALKGLEGALLRHIDKDTVKQVMAKTPGVINNYPGSEQYKLSEDLETPMLERWSDDALDELSKKPKDEWTEADWDTYNYCKNANAERDYYDSLDESSSQDYYNYITKMKTLDSDNKLVNSEESIEDFVKRVTSANDSVQYVADKIEQVGDKYYLIGFKNDMSQIKFLLGTPGEDASERNVKHILKNPHWHISLSLKDDLSRMYLSNSINEAKKKNKGVYLNKDAGNVEHNVAAFNHAMCASESPSTNPCGPMGESVKEGLNNDTRRKEWELKIDKATSWEEVYTIESQIKNDPYLSTDDEYNLRFDIDRKYREFNESKSIKEDFVKTKDYEYYKVAVPSPSGKGSCSFGVHEHNDGHCSISGIHPYDDGDYHWATSKDGVTFNIYVGNPGKLVKKFVSDHNGYEDICSEIANLDRNVKSVMVHW